MRIKVELTQVGEFGTVYTAELGEDRVWKSEMKGIRQALQALSPSEDTLPTTPSNPSRVYEIVQEVARFVPLIITEIIDEQSPYIKGGVY